MKLKERESGTRTAASRTHAPARQARDLLARNADNAQAALESVRADALALRDKITITEARLSQDCRPAPPGVSRPVQLQVSLARVYNFGVATKQGTQQRQEET